MAKRRKTWYTIIAPKIFDNIELGETPAIAAKDVIGRTLTLPLSSIIPDTRKFYMKVSFKIIDVKDTTAYTKFIGHEVVREYVTHIVRPHTTRVDNNIVVQTKDGVKIRVKGILIFAGRVKEAIKTKARKIMDEVTKRFASEKDFDDFVKAMLFDELTKVMKEKARKLYPVAKVEIRKSEVLSK